MHPAPDAGRVDEAPRLATELDELVHGVTGGAGDVVHHDTVLAGELVEQRGLADVGASDQGHSARAAALVGVGVGGDGRQDVEDGVEDVATPPAVQGRDRPRLAESEVPEGGRVGLGALVVDLVGHEDDRLAGAAQQLDHGLVVVGGADGGIHDEHHDIGEVHGHLRLLGDAQVDARGVDLPAAGVDEGEPATGPLPVIGDAVAGHTGHVLDDSLPAAEDAVDEGGLADVRASDHGDDRQRAVDDGITVLVVLTVDEGAVLVAEVELVQPNAQGALDSCVVGQVLAHFVGSLRCSWGPDRKQVCRAAAPHCRALLQSVRTAAAQLRSPTPGPCPAPPVAPRRAGPGCSARSRGPRCRPASRPRRPP